MAGTSLLKVDHYKDRVTSLATMLAHEQPYKAFEPEISSKPESAPHPALATSNDHEADQVPAPKVVKSLFETDLDNVEDCNTSFDLGQHAGDKLDVHESVEIVEEEKNIETPDIPEYQENNDDDDFDFPANVDASEPNEMVANEATEEIEESQKLIQKAVLHDHWYLEPFESEPPNAKRPRLDQG